MEKTNIEHKVKSNEICSLTMVRRVAAMLDLDSASFSEGDVLPQGWHFFMLAGETRKSELRQDGFPGLGVQIPDFVNEGFSLTRLLLGGRTVVYESEIIIGSVVEKVSFIKNITEKITKNGPIAIVTIQHELRCISAEKPSIIETQTYVLLEAQKVHSSTDLESVEKPQLLNEGQYKFTPDETLLFQYSALGFNSHKIHLDRNYAQNVEGLPDLVVNGGLTTLLFTEYFRIKLKQKLKSIHIKHLAPLYCNRSFTIMKDEQNFKIFNNKNEVAVEINCD